MILDNVRFHHAKLLKPFLEKNKDKNRVNFYQPIVLILIQSKEFGGI
jgi:hypothetical protein